MHRNALQQKRMHDNAVLSSRFSACLYEGISEGVMSEGVRLLSASVGPLAWGEKKKNPSIQASLLVLLIWLDPWSEAPFIHYISWLVKWDRSFHFLCESLPFSVSLLCVTEAWHIISECSGSVCLFVCVCVCGVIASRIVQVHLFCLSKKLFSERLSVQWRYGNWMCIIPGGCQPLSLLYRLHLKWCLCFWAPAVSGSVPLSS